MKPSPNTIGGVLKLWDEKIDPNDQDEFNRIIKEYAERAHLDLPLNFKTIVQPMQALDPGIWKANGNGVMTADNIGHVTYELAERLAAPITGATASQALLFIARYVGHWLTFGENFRDRSFAAFRVGYLLHALERDLVAITSDQKEEYPKLLERAAMIQDEAKRLSGKGVLQFMYANWDQHELCLGAAKKAGLDASDFQQRLKRAARGLCSVDGQYLRSDDVVAGLVNTITQRMSQRAQQLATLEAAVRKMLNLKPNASVSIHLSGPSMHLHDVRTIQVETSRRRFRALPHEIEADLLEFLGL